MSILATLGRGVLMAPDPPAGGAGGGAPAPATSVVSVEPSTSSTVAVPPAGAAPPAPAPGEAPPAGTGDPPPDDGDEGERLTLTKTALTQRMSRHHASQLKKLGLDSDEALEQRLARATELETQEEERQRKAMSEQERLQADATAAADRATAAEAERDQVRFEAHVSGICARLGVKNIDYAMWAVETAANGLPDGQELDVEVHLTEMLGVDTSRAALGTAPAVQTEQQPATTTPIAGGPPPPPPPPGGGGQPTNVMDMSREDFQKHLAGQGIGLPSA